MKRQKLLVILSILLIIVSTGTIGYTIYDQVVGSLSAQKTPPNETSKPAGSFPSLLEIVPNNTSGNSRQQNNQSEEPPDWKGTPIPRSKLPFVIYIDPKDKILIALATLILVSCFCYLGKSHVGKRDFREMFPKLKNILRTMIGVIVVTVVLTTGILLAENQLLESKDKKAQSPPTSTDPTEVETKGKKEIKTEETVTNERLESTENDISALIVKNGGNATLDHVTIKKTGDTSNTEQSEWYGVNAALLTKKQSETTINNSTVETSAVGANAIVANGKKGIVQVNDVKIVTTQDSSRGLDATDQGTIKAINADITTSGAHAAAVATDRGEGTITVSDSKLNTSGEGSPLLYSTGSITANNVTGTASGSGIAIVEGNNTTTIYNSEISGFALGCANEGIDNAGVMIYQSMSKEASVGIGVMNINHSKLTIPDQSPVYDSAPMFLVTNTDARINLTNTELNYGSNQLLTISGNDGQWGEAGKNGGTVTLYAKEQTLVGTITVDNQSAVQINLESSHLKGSIDHAKTAKRVTLKIETDSDWEVTEDSYLTNLTIAQNDTSKIKDNGHTIYYDATAKTNQWLDGKTIVLQDGGKLTPGES